MGIYQYTDPTTGRSYNFEHAGDAPTNEDYAYIADFLREDRDKYAEKYADVFGREFETPDDGTAIGRGYGRGTKQVKQAFGETIGTLGEQAGLGFLEDYGTGLEERARQEQGILSLTQPERMQSTDVDGVGSALTYAGEILGEQIPQFGLGLAGAGATAVAAPLLGAGALTTSALGFAAYGAAQAPMLFGNNIQRREDVVGADNLTDDDVYNALKATFGQAALESISGKLLLKSPFRAVGKDITGAKGLFVRTAGRATGGATTEGLTEVGQQMMERAQAGLEIDSDEAYAEYREAAIAGGLLGGGVRATGFGERGDTTPIVPEADQTPEQEVDTAQQVEATELLGDVSTSEVDAALTAVAPDAVIPAPTMELTPAQEAVVAEEGPKAEELIKTAKAKVAEYSAPTTVADVALPEVKPFEKPSLARTVANKLGVETKITDEMLADVGIPKSSPLRLPKSKGTVLGGDLFDPEVQKKLRNFALQSLVRTKFPDLEARVEALIGGADAGLGITPTDIEAGFGDGAQGSGPSVEPLDGGASTSGDTAVVTPPVTGPVGDNLRPTSGDAVSTELGAGTLETEVSPEAVADLTQEVDVLTAKPIAPVQAAPQPQVIPQATPAMVQAAAPGQVTQTAGQVIPPAIPPAPRAAPAQIQAAPVPQADLQAVETASSDVAQAQLDSTFENNRGKQPEIREYHDTQLDARSAPEITTAVDKEGVVELINTKDANLDATGKAAKLYFKRFRRLVDALAEIGATGVVGPTQSIAKDYTPAQFSFYKGMTQKSAMNARRWVHANMSDSSIQEMIRARRIANRDTAKFTPSDAYVGVTKAMKGIQQKEDNALKNQLNRYLASPEMNYQAPADLDQSLRVEGATSGPITGSFKPVKGQTAFDSYMLGMGFKKRKVPNKDEYTYSDPENDNKVLTPEEVQEFYDGLTYTQNELGFLLVDPVHGLDMALLPSIRNALQRGDLQFALNAIASTNPVDRVRQVAAKLAEVVGTTQVQVVDDLSQTVGRKAAGLFDPETNTISIDANNGINVHTILHEMTHAATSASLANKALPEVKQLNSLLTAVKEQFGEVYGTANIDEFVAEAFSNPEFQSALALTPVDNSNMSGWEKFTGAVRNIVRKLIGLQSKRPESTLDEVDRIINGMLTPSPDTRAAPSMLLAASTPKGSVGIAQSAIDAVPASNRAEYVEMAGDILYNKGEPAYNGVKNVILGSLDSRILADVAKKKIPFAPELNIMIRKMSGAMRKRNDSLDAMVNNYASWTRNNKGAAKVLNNIIPKSTALRVDPSLPREFYSTYKAAYNDIVTKKAVIKEFKSEKARLAWVQQFNAAQDNAKTTKAKNMKDPDPQDLVAYDALLKQYKSIGSEGQAFYRQMRNYFQDTYDEIIPALRARLDATISDDAVRASAFEKLQDILMKESGIIRPYFPLMRKGKHRLQYTFLNEQGQPEVAVEYYQNRRSLDRAFKIAESNSASGTKPEYSRADRPMNFNTVPSSSFVFDILKTMEMSKSSFKDPAQYEAAVQSVVDLALDAMPERSFMQGFRRRKDVRGYIGDTTPTKIGDTEFDALTMMKEKGRDLNRQIIQIQSAAEIEKFRNKLKDGGYLNNPETADVARKLDQIAAFAQKPNVPRWSQAANGVGFAMTMGFNFSSAAITFFDVAMSAMPIISAEYGVGQTAAAYGDATRLVAGAPKKRGVMVSGPDGKPIEQEVKTGVVGKSMFNYTFDQLPEAEKAIRLDILLDTASDQGQANQSQTQESLEVGRDAPLEFVNSWTSAMFHHAERVNRETTLRAAYGLEVQKLQAQGKALSDQDYRDAAQKAIETTEFTLGSTAAAGRPVWAQSGVGNVLFLFKRFAIAKYYMMYKLGHDSIGSTNIERIMQEQGVTEADAQQIAADRKLARVGLRNFLITTGVMAGAGGMPMMGAFGAIYNMFADDDEDDFESALRKYTGEGIYGGLANQVLGVDVANRISLNSLLYRPPLIKKDDQSPIWTLAEQLGGPVVGLSTNVVRGGLEMVEGFQDSNLQSIKRGAETIVPSAIRNVSKGIRFYTEGANTRRGDPITGDINAYNAVMQAAGFAPQAYIQQLEFNKNARRREEAVGSRRTKLLRRHNMALREGDREEAAKVRKMIQEYNEGLPAGAKKSRITEDTIARSNRSFERTTGKMKGGMTYTPFMESVLEEYDKGFQGF